MLGRHGRRPLSSRQEGHEHREDEAGREDRVAELQRLEHVPSESERDEETERAIHRRQRPRRTDAGTSTDRGGEIAHGHRTGREENDVGRRLHRRDERDEDERGRGGRSKAEDRRRERIPGIEGGQRFSRRERDGGHGESEDHLRHRGEERGSPGGRLVAAREELRVDVASHEVRQTDQDEEREHLAGSDRRGEREAPDLGGQTPEPPRAGEREVQRNSRNREDHDAVLDEVRPRHRELSAERGVAEKDGGRGEQRGQRRHPKGRGQNGLRRRDQQGEPHDLRDEHEGGGGAAGAGPVVAADDLRKGHGALAPHAGG